MKQTVRIAGGINEFFGTLDENLKFFESALRVTTHLQDHDLEIEGEPEQVERAARTCAAYNERVREGHAPDSGEVRDLLRAAAGEPTPALRGAFSPTRTQDVRQESRRAEKPQSEALHRGDRSARHGVRHRAGRHGKDVSRGGHGRFRAAFEGSESHHSGAAGGGSGRTARISCPERCRKKSIRTCGRFTTPCTICSKRTSSSDFSKRTSSKSRRWRLCAGAR